MNAGCTLRFVIWQEGDNVDNQKVTVFRQKNKVGLTAAAIAGCLAVSPMLGAGVFLPQVLTTVPVLLLAMLGYAGPVSMAVCSGILVALCSTLFGVWGGLSAALLIVPTVISSMVMILYNLADTYFVGCLNDPIQNSAVTLAAALRKCTPFSAATFS